MPTINLIHANDHREDSFSALQIPTFTRADFRQMKDLEIAHEQVLTQLETFRRSSFHVRLSKPCIVRDGVRQLTEQEAMRYLQLHEHAAKEGRFTKFVPASGAATRMFQSLLKIYNMPQDLNPDELHLMAEQSVSAASAFIRFLAGLGRLPFIIDLKETLAKNNLDICSLLHDCQYRTILDYLLSDVGLNYGSLPKALLKFHRYPDGCRTALEEHLVEAVGYLADAAGKCTLHFTVSSQHQEGFARLLDKIGPRYEERCCASFNLTFSHQEQSTNTIAVDMDNRPFRDRRGRLHFRPGGHGALIKNLDKLAGDLIYIRNIDNLVPDRLKDGVAYWKKILGGCLVDVQEAVHGFVRRLMNELSVGLIEAAAQYAHERLSINLPKDFHLQPMGKKREWFLRKLNRPIRVCGVVPNSGQPGGAPFWVEKDADVSVQIVEQAQVDFDSPRQRDIWMSSTHFNPVDIVCGVRDYAGRPFDLGKHVDRDAVFITRKSKDGRDLKALELPGLWNGAMADWITVVVEVPAETFNPVKTVLDLLKPEHQQ